jgi:radical SAM protein with 4Fe4S-binding SPASM domain
MAKHCYLEVELENYIYEIEFGQIQIEITGRCNMCCKHCRAANQLKRDMSLDQITKVVSFAKKFSSNNLELVLSGGEPLMHKNFFDILKLIKENGCNFITLTTNGSLLTNDHLLLIKSLGFKRFLISVSLENINPDKHDKFRLYDGAFSKAIDALKLVADANSPNIIASVRCTIQASQIKEMKDMVGLAKKIGCRRISFSDIRPVGKASEQEGLCMNREQKMAFLKEVYRLKKMFYNIDITTNDPLKCLLKKEKSLSTVNELVFDGCGAAAITFNVDSDGCMTPRALLNIPIMNIFPLTINKIIKTYQNSDVVKNMLLRNFKGKCGSCNMKQQCGGCRVRAFVQKGDYLEEDPHCWL